MRHPYTQALFRSIPLPGADKNSRPLVAIPGNFPAAERAPEGLQFRPALRLFRGRALRRRRYPDGYDRRRRPARVALPARRDIDWDAPIRAAVEVANAEIGDVVLKVDNLKKYYEVAASALFSHGEKKVVKANETLSFEAREAETLAIVGERAAASPRWPRC